MTPVPGPGPSRYRGYRSYQYLEPQRDYRVFELSAEVDRVPSRAVPTSEEEEGRVQRLLAEGPIISLHDHPVVLPARIEELLEYRRHGRDWTGYLGLSRSGLHAVIDNLADGEGLITSRSGWKWDETLADLGMRLCDLEHQDYVRVVRRFSDIEAARAEGQLALILGIESATPIENELDRLDILHGFGIRSVGVTYSEANLLGCGLAEADDAGLTAFGRRAVRRMNQLGILIDCAHAGDRTTLETIEASSAPVTISHAGARAVWPTRRMKPDEVIRACADSGGVIGIEAAPHTTLTREDTRHGIDTYMAHFEYCAELVGIEHVGFGPDTLFGDHVGMHRVMAAWFGEEPAVPPQPIERVDWVQGLESPAEALTNIVRWLVVHGYPDREILMAAGGNALRMLEFAWRSGAAG
ncbi:MAG: membrane dipeptidase [Candidatus Dormibacteraeota bacterium]|nr:membrane dipeptidase [Candidatus Dormibacteraeota bacterium]